jgi:hypothetical protein
MVLWAMLQMGVAISKMMLMRRSGHLRVALLTLIVVPVATHAATVCYDQSYYPSVGRLHRTESGIAVVMPGGRDGQGYPAAFYSDARGWESGDYSCASSNECDGDHAKETGFPGPAITLSMEEAIKLEPELAGAAAIEQKIGAWTFHDGAFWFGLSFYSGEGESGVGGVGRYDPVTKEQIIRRPSLIRDSSIHHIVGEGQTLWFSTDAEWECIGDVTLHGLARYDWEADRLETFEGRDDGPCGFSVNDLLLDAKYLWVATDLGLSRRDRTTGKWDHFVPEPGASPPMQATTCEALYSKLLGSLPREENEDLISYHSQLFTSLEQFRPRFLTRYVESLAPGKWGSDELRFLGRKAADLRSLNESVLKFLPVGADDVGFALLEFGEKRPRDPEWQELLHGLRAPPNQQSDILDLLEHFSPDDKIGDVLALRISTVFDPGQEPDVLSAYARTRNASELFKSLDRYRNDKAEVHFIESIIIALMASTRTVLGQDGKETKLLPGASPDNCIFGCPPTAEAVMQLADHWLAWRDTHKQETENGQESDGDGAQPLAPPTN